MFKKFFILSIITCLTIPVCFTQEDKYSLSLSRMENEWLCNDFAGEADQLRINRLEQNLFGGTVMDDDLNVRYNNLRRLFDRQKQQNIIYNDDGNPTSTPVDMNNLYNDAQYNLGY